MIIPAGNNQINSLIGVANNKSLNMSMYDAVNTSVVEDGLSRCTDSKLLEELDNRLIAHGILLPKENKKLLNNLFDLQNNG